MLTFAVEKSIKTVTTYRVLSFHRENEPSKILFFATNSNADLAILKNNFVT